MVCKQAEKHLPGCMELVSIFKEKSRFVLGLSQHQDTLTHMQLMKIRCGGLRGMQRILSGDDAIPDVLEVIKATTERYAGIANFPFNEIVRDIKEFSHRNKKKTDQG